MTPRRLLCNSRRCLGRPCDKLAKAIAAARALADALADVAESPDNAPRRLNSAEGNVLKAIFHLILVRATGIEPVQALRPYGF